MAAAVHVSVWLSKSVQERWPGSAQTQGPSLRIEMATQVSAPLARLLEAAPAGSEPRPGSPCLQPVLGGPARPTRPQMSGEGIDRGSNSWEG